MPETINRDTPITTTIGCVLDFFGVLVNKWAPAFELSIKRDKATRFSYERFQDWLDENYGEFKWSALFPPDGCNAKVKSGKRKGMPCSRKAKTYDQDQIESRVKLDENGEPTKEIENIVTHKKGEIINGFCSTHKKLAEDIVKLDRTAQANPSSDDVNGTLSKMADSIQQLQKSMNIMLLRQNGMRDRLDRIDPKHDEEMDEKFHSVMVETNMERIKEGKKPLIPVGEMEARELNVESRIKEVRGEFVTEGRVIGDMIREKHPDYKPRPDPSETTFDYYEDRILQIQDEMKRGELLKNSAIADDPYVVDELDNTDDLISKEEMDRDREDRKNHPGEDKAFCHKLYDLRGNNESIAEVLDNMVSTKEISDTDKEIVKSIMYESKMGKLRNPI
ncbi:hypothetical protein IWW36_003519, partial [Coemansia brasiliensis]